MTALDAPVTDDHAPPRRIIVVGVDGSRASATALHWALDHLVDDGGVRIVTAFAHPHSTVDVPLSYIDLYDLARDGARERAEQVIDEVLGGASSLLVEHIVAPGSIDDVISQHAGDADMVVLGTQSRRRWRDRLRSSTTNRLTGHITVPVISVPEARSY